MARTPQFDRTVALNNAMALFWRQGYHATSMKDIEVAIDMRPGSIYAAFGNKESLFREALGSYGANTQEWFAASLAEGKREIDGFYALTYRMVEQTQSGIPSKACMLIKTLLELSNNERFDNQFIKHYMLELQNLFVAKFKRVIAAGELAIGSDPERLARLYQSAILGLSVMAQRDLPAAQLQQLAEDNLQLLFPSQQS